MVLNATRPPDQPKDVHFWFGKSYNDVPPYWIGYLGDLGPDWDAVQHLEFQDSECKQFLNYFRTFQPAIRYQRGEYPEQGDEGYSHFYILSKPDGEYRVQEIEFCISFMQEEKTFILDSVINTRAYISNKTPEEDNQLALEMVQHIRAVDYDGEGKTEAVDLTTFYKQEDKRKVEKARVIEKRRDFKKRVTDLDEVMDEPVENAELYWVSVMPEAECWPKINIDRSKKAEAKKNKKLLDVIREGCMDLFGKTHIEEYVPEIAENIELLPLSKPMTRKKLNIKKCYILKETLGCEIYFWIGEECEAEVKKEVLKWIRSEIGIDDTRKINTVHRWRHVTIIPQGKEPAKFKRYFQTW